MTEPSAKVASLDAFLRSNGAALHPNIFIAENEASGLHWRAKGNIGPQSTLISVPHKLSLSYLNALVDENGPEFQRVQERISPDFRIEAITFFYFMHQYLNREASFWRPYLEALPGPNEEHTQPLFFDPFQDRQWLEGSPIGHTNRQREEKYRAIYEEGKAALRRFAYDKSEYTWHLFKWAAATFTSRSFNSRALNQGGSKYWAAHKHNGDQSQTVLLDLSHSTATDFPVLFPGLDIGNHNPHARIEYIFDPGRFEIKTYDNTVAGDEVYNNYGTKSNNELFLGYGFVVPDNPHNSVPMKLKAPPEKLQRELMPVHPGYFHVPYGGDTKQWNSEKATFQLTLPPRPVVYDELYTYLPEPLIELLVYKLDHERGYPFALIENPQRYIYSAKGRRYLPHIANIVMQSLMRQLSELQRTSPTTNPQNARQTLAQTHRQDSAFLLKRLIRHLQETLTFLLTHGGEITTNRHWTLTRLEQFIVRLRAANALPPDFLSGLGTIFGTSNLEVLRANDWEEDIWTLLLVALAVIHESDAVRKPHYVGPNEDDEGDRALTDAQKTLYELEPDHPAHELKVLVDRAAEQMPGSMWARWEWMEELLYEFHKVVEMDGFWIMCPTGRGEEKEVRLCVYLEDKYARDYYTRGEVEGDEG